MATRKQILEKKSAEGFERRKESREELIKKKSAKEEAKKKRNEARREKHGLTEKKKELELQKQREALPKEEVIKAEREKTSVEKFAETPVGKVLTSPKTTAALGGTLLAVPATAALGTAGVGATVARVAAPSVATITRTAFQGSKSVTTQRAFTGKAAQSGVDKIFHSVRPVAQRFATNAKSQTLTQSLLKKIGGVPALMGVIGTYPFAGFIKEEALQTLGFGVFAAKNDPVGMEAAITAQEELLNPSVWQQLINTIPFVNVVNQLNNFYEAARTKLEIDKRNLEKLKGNMKN